MAIRKNLSKHLSGLPNVVSLLFNSDSYCLSQRHSGLSPISYIFVKTVVCPLFPFVKTVVCPLFPSPISYILFSHATFSSKNVALGF